MNTIWVLIILPDLKAKELPENYNRLSKDKATDNLNRKWTLPINYPPASSIFKLPLLFSKQL